MAVEVLIYPSGIPEHCPAWPAYVAAAIFLLAGMGHLMNLKGRASALLGGLICAGMVGLGFFAAFGTGTLEGGLPLIPATWNQTIGRAAFGFGAIITAAFALWGFHRALKPPKKK